MLETLKFVQGAVAKKDFVPALNHFHISDGRITSYNGTLTLSSPIALDIDASPKATTFIKAIQSCKETVVMHLTPARRLSIKSGKFKAFIDCDDLDAFPDTAPSGQEVEMDGKILPALKTLLPFIAEDASRPWARGILFRGQSCFATNNIIIAEHWLGFTTFGREANLPQEAVKELVRIGKEPESIQIDERSMTFHFADGRWLKTQLYTAEWPVVTEVLDRESIQSPVPKEVFPAIQEIMPFINEHLMVYFSPGRVYTCPQEGEGASVDLEGIPEEALFNAKQFLLLEKVVRTIDLTNWPAPCLFFGDKIRGAIIGMRDV